MCQNKIGTPSFSCYAVRSVFHVLLGESKVGLHHAVAVDGLEVVAHGDDVETGRTPLLAQGEGLFAVGMVALVVVSNEHKGGRLVFRITLCIVVHGHVAAAVAEGQDCSSS